MSRIWLCLLGVSVLSVSFGLAQTPLRSDRDTDPRAVVPSALKQPTNRVPESARVRSFLSAPEERATVPAVSPRYLTEPSTRTRWSDDPHSIGRSLLGPAETRDPKLARPEPGDKRNHIPKELAPRYLLEPEGHRVMPSSTGPDRSDRIDRGDPRF